MFRSFIYLDEEKMYSYYEQIDPDFANRPVETRKNKKRGASFSALALNVQAATEIEERRELYKAIEKDYNNFELMLDSFSDTEYFDFVLNNGYDLSTVPRMSIVRLNGRILIPEQFDAYRMIEGLKPFLGDYASIYDDKEKNLFEFFLSRASADIPIIIDDNDITLSSKLNTLWLREGYEELEDYSEQEVYILCKIIGMINKDMVEVFSPLKDFIKLPRAVRRSINTKENGLESIFIEGPVLKTEIIAVYK